MTAKSVASRHLFCGRLCVVARSCERASTSTTLQRPNLRPCRESGFALPLPHQIARAIPTLITSSDVRRNTSERWREGDVEHEHYTDSGGKSGGQKEKLAYTVLAASLAYQFGLDQGDSRPRSFRFVVIDEAFGRGSDESARYGLELFERMNLQLLIVTPLQKIHIIEPHVASVGFVHNDEGRSSMLRNLTIEEYRAEKVARSA